MPRTGQPPMSEAGEKTQAPPSERALPLGPGLLLAALWTWAIWTCAEHWRGNPNYSYGWAVPLLALGFGLRRYWRMNNRAFGRAVLPRAAGGLVLIMGVLGLAL